jgi:hypothetical protein
VIKTIILFLQNLRNNIFKTFFRQVACVSLAHNGEQLNRECSLFSECGKKVSQQVLKFENLYFLVNGWKIEFHLIKNPMVWLGLGLVDRTFQSSAKVTSVIAN